MDTITELKECVVESVKDGGFRESLQVESSGSTFVQKQIKQEPLFEDVELADVKHEPEVYVKKELHSEDYFQRGLDVQEHESQVASWQDGIICDDKSTSMENKEEDQIQEEWMSRLKIELHGRAYSQMLHLGEIEITKQSENGAGGGMNSCAQPIRKRGRPKMSSANKLEEKWNWRMAKKKFPCTKCPQSFAYEKSLNRHVLHFHSNLKLFSCAQCPKAFHSQGPLTAHSTRKHPNFKPLCCAYCPKKFHVRLQLTKHLLIHLVKRPFSCTRCAKSFRCQRLLQIHMTNDHFDDKIRFSCAFCPKNFRCKFILTGHIQAHLGQPTFPCMRCPEIFSQSTDLEKHQLYCGKIWSCPECQKRFFNETAFIRHKNVHSKREKYSCDLCLAPFFIKVNLKRHVLLHFEPPRENFQGNEPFSGQILSCSECPEKFFDRSTFRRHSRFHEKFQRSLEEKLDMEKSM